MTTPPQDARWVLRVVCVADGSPTPLAGRYVRRWHPSATRPGLPMVDATDDATKARSFATAAEAYAYWTEVNRKHPVRPDGQPNRPMTAYTCEVLNVGG